MFCTKLEVDIMTISQRIFLELKKQNKTQKQMSLSTGIKTSTISAWNKNGTNPSADYIYSIAQFLNVSLEYLLVGEEKSSPSILTENEQRMLEIFSGLTPTQQGELIGRASAMSEHNDAEAKKKDRVS